MDAHFDRIYDTSIAVKEAHNIFIHELSCTMYNMITYTAFSDVAHIHETNTFNIFLFYFS